MFRALSTLIGLALTCTVNANTLRLSEPVRQDAISETFGVELDNALSKVSMQSLTTDPSLHLSKPFQVEARIAKVCQKKGCFFIAQQAQHTLRVSFQNYGFFIPTDSSGKTVTLSGELVKRELSPEQVAHFKADLKNETNIVKPGVVYEIVAYSVKIPRS
jgi:hypothetical protein